MRFYIKSILILLTTLSTSHLRAQLQGQAKIDSMLKDIAVQKEDTNMAKSAYCLSSAYSSVNPEEGLKYARQALALSTKLGWQKGIAWSYNGFGSNYMSEADYPKALEYFQKASKVFEATGDKKGMAAAVCNIGVIYRGTADYPKALKYLLTALKMDEEGNYIKFAGIASDNIASVYSAMEDYETELTYRLKSLKMFEKIGDKAGISLATGNIGITYCDGLKDYPKALEYFFKALALDEEIGNRNMAPQITINIGMAYEKMKNYTEAAKYYQIALKLSDEFGDKVQIAAGLIRFGSLYVTMLRDTDLAKHMKPSATDKWVKKTEPATKAYKTDGLIPQGRAAMLKAAIDYLERGLAFTKQLESPNTLMDCYGNLANAYTLNKEFKKALESANNYYAIKDSLFSQGNKEEILKIGMKNEYDRQRLADSLKVAEKEKIAAFNLQKQKSFTYLGIAGILLLAGFSFFIVKERGKSERERKKSDDLLLNILPSEVAQELKAKGRSEAKQFDNVTVLFTDFVNFTTAGERMSAKGLVNELHSCFKAFDDITNKYGLEKIKTIGDSYLAVAGLPTADPKHAENTVKAANEINQFMQDRLGKLGKERTFEMRIGVHSGSVVAGIVGIKKFAYDIWGDTVNTAARMEQNSEAGRINISQTTYELVKDKINCEYRGEIDAKGKGQLKMYFVS